MAVDASTPVGVESRHRRHSQGCAGDRHELRLSARHRQGRVRPQSQSHHADVDGDRPVPVHRADLARHLEAGGAGLRLRQLRQCDLAHARPAATWWRIRRLRAEIMQLRKDPTANALMGGVFTQQNAAVLCERLGRAPSEGELYIAHFFGPYGAAKAISLAAEQSQRQRGRNLSGGGARQSADLLRQAGQRAQHRRRLRGIGAPLPGRARRSRAPAIAAARPTPSAADLAPQPRAKGRAAQGRRCSRHQPSSRSRPRRSRPRWRSNGTPMRRRRRRRRTREDRCGRRHVSFAVPDRRAARGDRACDQRAVERRVRTPRSRESRMSRIVACPDSAPLRRPGDKDVGTSSICSAIRARPRAGDPVAGSVVRALTICQSFQRFMVNALLRLAH